MLAFLLVVILVGLTFCYHLCSNSKQKKEEQITAEMRKELEREQANLHDQDGNPRTTLGIHFATERDDEAEEGACGGAAAPTNVRAVYQVPNEALQAIAQLAAAKSSPVTIRRVERSGGAGGGDSGSCAVISSGSRASGESPPPTYSEVSEPFILSI